MRSLTVFGALLLGSLFAMACAPSVEDDADSSENAVESTKDKGGDFIRAYRGTGAYGYPALMRLTRAGTKLSGVRLDPKIDDISIGSTQGFAHELEGSVDATGKVTLNELDPATNAVVGTYKGTFSGNGDFTGTLHANNDAFEPTVFDLKVLAPGAAADAKGAPIGYHRVGPNFEDPAPTCLRSTTYPEVLGIESAAAESALNKSFATVALDTTFCNGQPKGSATSELVVTANMMGVLGVYGDRRQLDASGSALQRTQHFFSVGLKTGKRLTLADMLVPNSDAKLKTLIHAALARSTSTDKGLEAKLDDALAKKTLAVLVLDSLYNDARISGLLLSPSDGKPIADPAATSRSATSGTTSIGGACSSPGAT